MAEGWVQLTPCGIKTTCFKYDCRQYFCITTGERPGLGTHTGQSGSLIRLVMQLSSTPAHPQRGLRVSPGELGNNATIAVGQVWRTRTVQLLR
ncbi:hypothetical protein KCP73_12910 [Salmonella enterica subsp. enterica]|nr:hypothetical protein KCP73_12910 [Salmonella enterica subsp. enterica]